MTNQELTSQVEGNYYDTFIASILSLPFFTRSFVLANANKNCEDGNPYLYLWEKYNQEITNESSYLHDLLDEYKLAID